MLYKTKSRNYSHSTVLNCRGSFSIFGEKFGKFSQFFDTKSVLFQNIFDFF